MKYFIVLLFTFLLCSCNKSDNPVSPPVQTVPYSHFKIFECFGKDSVTRYTMLMIEDSIKYSDSIVTIKRPVLYQDSIFYNGYYYHHWYDSTFGWNLRETNGWAYYLVIFDSVYKFPVYNYGTNSNTFGREKYFDSLIVRKMN
jgi:hypothetical protein